jgi:hypothetical protein
MRSGLFTLLLAYLLGAAPLLLAPGTATAATSLPVNSPTTHVLVGNSGGSIDTYYFTSPNPVAAPTITVTFTPSLPAIEGRAGFMVFPRSEGSFNGGKTAIPGVITAVLPLDEASVMPVEVFNYSDMAVSFTITTQNIIGNFANGPVGNNFSQATATPLDGTLTESLPANTGGVSVWFNVPSQGQSPPTVVSMIYYPADGTLSQGVGFNVYDSYGNIIGSVAQPTNFNMPTGLLQVNLGRTPGEQLKVAVFNYAVGVPVTYTLTVTGIPPLGAPSAAASSGFSRFWVENFKPTPIWSGPNAAAVSFGVQGLDTHFLVVLPQYGPRLYVYVPSTHNYGWVDANAVGPSGPPSAAG